MICFTSIGKWREKTVSKEDGKDGVKAGQKQFYIRVHVYSTLEVKQTTTISVDPVFTDTCKTSGWRYNCFMLGNEVIRGLGDCLQKAKG